MATFLRRAVWFLMRPIVHLLAMMELERISDQMHRRGALRPKRFR